MVFVFLSHPDAGQITLEFKDGHTVIPNNGMYDILDGGDKFLAAVPVNHTLYIGKKSLKEVEVVCHDPKS